MKPEPREGGRPEGCRTEASPRYVLGLFSELLGVGGVQEAGRQTIAAFDAIARARGWRTKFLSLNDPRGEHSLSGFANSVSFYGFGRAKLSFTIAAIRGARAAGNNSDAIVLAAHPHLAPPAALARLFSPNARMLIMSHGVEVWQPLAPLRRRALLRADRVLAPSSYTAEKLATMQGVSKENIRKLPWPLDATFRRMAENPAALPLPPDFPQGRVILTVGRWAAAERYKGVDDLIRATAQLRPRIPDVHLVAIGSGDDLPRLERLTRELGAGEFVHYLQGLTREQLGASYARAGVFALPSTGEGFGFVFLEAMAFGKPVVGAAVGGPADLIEHEGNGLLVAPGDLRQLTEALARLLEDEAYRAELGGRSREVVNTQYDFETFTAGLSQILEECL
ncbi:MAG: glycosyltransferase family 4 protein [Candidatus Acidiferrales bacterium]